MNTGGNLPALLEARAAQEQDLRKQVAQLRSEAAADLARARDDVGERVTMAEWVEWFNKNSAHFAEARKTATQERRAFSRRLQADRSLPRQPRAPPAAHADSGATLNPLQRLLRGRSGWHSVLLPGRLLLLFLWRQGATTWILDLTKIGTLRNRVVYIRYDAVMSSALQPLALFLTEAAAGATVHENAISAACTEEGIAFSFVDTEHIVSEMRRPPPARRTKKQHTRSVDSDDESGSSSSCSEASSAADLPSQRSEDSDVLPEVETDLESAVDDPGVGISSGSDTDGAAAALAPDGAAGHSCGPAATRGPCSGTCGGGSRRMRSTKTSASTSPATWLTRAWAQTVFRCRSSTNRNGSAKPSRTCR